MYCFLYYRNNVLQKNVRVRVRASRESRIKYVVSRKIKKDMRHITQKLYIIMVAIFRAKWPRMNKGNFL